MGRLFEIFRSAAVISGNNLVTTAINYLIFLAVIASLGAHEFGIYALAMSAMSFATFFLDFGMSKVVVSDVSKEMNSGNMKRAAALFKGYAYFQIALAAFIAILAFSASGWIAEYLQKDLVNVIRLLSALIFTAGVKIVYQTSFEIVADFRKWAAYQFIDAASKLLLLIVGFWAFGPVIEVALATMILSDVFTIILRLWGMPENIRNMMSMKGNDWGPLAEMIRSHGKWAFMLSQIKNIESNAPIWIVEHALGVNWAGVYFALTKLQSILARLFEPLDTIFYPLVTKLGNISDSRKAIVRATKYIIYLAIPSVAAMWALADLILKTVPESLVQENAWAFRVFSLSIFLVILNIPYKPLIFNMKQQKSLAMNSAVVLVLGVATGYWLTALSGIIGMAISRLVVSTIDVGLKIMIVKRMAPEFTVSAILLPDKADFDLFRKLVKKALAITF